MQMQCDLYGSGPGFWPLLLFLCSSLCNGLSSTTRPPACVPLLCLWALFPLLNSWGGCDFTPGQHSLKGQDCQDLPCGEHDGHHAWLSGGGQWEPGPGTRCSEPATVATEPGMPLYSQWLSLRYCICPHVSLLGIKLCGGVTVADANRFYLCWHETIVTPLFQSGVAPQLSDRSSSYLTTQMEKGGRKWKGRGSGKGGEREPQRGINEQSFLSDG